MGVQACPPIKGIIPKIKYIGRTILDLQGLGRGDVIDLRPDVQAALGAWVAGS